MIYKRSYQAIEKIMGKNHDSNTVKQNSSRHDMQLHKERFGMYENIDIISNILFNLHGTRVEIIDKIKQ